jgi:hypothetical protein
VILWPDGHFIALRPARTERTGTVLPLSHAANKGIRSEHGGRPSYANCHITVIGNAYNSPWRNSSAKQVCVVNIAVNMTVVRCPYCVAGDDFRPMTILSDGRLVCRQCGHLAIPSDKSFECVCRKCFALRGIGARRCG